MRCSRRSERNQPENVWSRALRQRRQSGKPLLDLTVSNPTLAQLPYPEPAIRQALNAPELMRYRPAPLGLPPARAAVSEVLAERGVTLSPDRIVLTASTSEAYSFLLKLLCDPGDGILVPKPGYPLLDELATYEAVEVRPYRLMGEDAWRVDASDLLRARRSNDRAVFALHPNNPTGSYLSATDLDVLASTGLPIVSDEVFASYPLSADPSRPPSALAAAGPLVFALGGLSKEAGLPQLKLSWIAVGGPDSAAEAALARLECIADAWLSVGTPVQLALPDLLRASRETREAIRGRIRRNLSAMREAVGPGATATLSPVAGGWYTCVRLPATESEERWVLRLLEEQGVVVHPGWLYDFEEEPWVVISLLTPPSILDQGLEALMRCLPTETDCRAMRERTV